MRKGFILIILAILLVCVSMQSRASDTNLSGFNLQYFRLTPDGSGALSVYGSNTLGHLNPYFRFDSNVSGSLIKASNPVNNQLVDLIKTLWTTDLSFALGLTDYINLSLQIPMNFFEEGLNDIQNRFRTTSLGDIGFEGKFRILKDSKKSPGLGILTRITAPTGDNQKFTGQGSPTVEFRSVVDKTWKDFYVVANLGYKLIDRHQIRNVNTGVLWNITDDDHLTFGLGAAYRLPWQNKTWSIKGQVIGETVIDNMREITTPVEFTIGVQKYLGHGFDIEMGGGRGITNAIGSPNYRAFAGLSYDFSFLGRRKRDELSESAKRFVSQTIYFDFDEYSVKPESYSKLQEVSQSLANRPDVKVNVDGHTDSIGKKSYNQKLSQKRAEKVREYLITFGTDEKQIFLNAYGENNPIVPNSTAEGRRHNRRVEITNR